MLPFVHLLSKEMFEKKQYWWEGVIKRIYDSGIPAVTKCEDMIDALHDARKHVTQTEFRNEIKKCGIS